MQEHSWSNSRTMGPEGHPGGYHESSEELDWPLRTHHFRRPFSRRLSCLDLPTPPSSSRCWAASSPPPLPRPTIEKTSSRPPGAATPAAAAPPVLGTCAQAPTLFSQHGHSPASRLTSSQRCAPPGEICAPPPSPLWRDNGEAHVLVWDHVRDHVSSALVRQRH